MARRQQRRELCASWCASAAYVERLGIAVGCGRKMTRERLKRAGKFIWRNLDVFGVMSVAAVVVALDILLPNLDPEIVSSATLALLGATAFALLRDRRGQERLNAIGQVAEDALSDLPYDIIWQENEWDLRDRRNSTIRMTQRVRFTRSEVSTLPHRSSGDGEVTSCKARWRRATGDAWINAPEIHKLRTREGVRVLFSLGEEHERGDMLDWEVEREALGRFSEAHEEVTHKAKTDSEFPRKVRIVWPANEPPSHIELRVGSGPPKRLSGKLEGDRVFVEESVVRLRKDELFAVSWNW